MENIPPQERDKVIEKIALTYPTWFLEAYVQFEGKPLILEPFQIAFLNDPHPFRIANKCRQTGGSMQVAMDKFYKAYTKPAYRCDIVSVNLKEATDKIKYIRNFWDSLPARFQIPLSTDNALSIGFHKGGKKSVVHSLAASAGIRGGKKEVFFDEFAHIMTADELFHAAAPAILNGDLGLDIVSTPLGRHNLFAKIYLNEIDPNTGKRPYDIFSRHQFIWCDVKRFVTDYEAAQHAWYIEYNQNMEHMHDMVARFANEKLLFFYHMFPFDMFLQEFCGEFVTDTDAFFPWGLIQKSLKGSLASADDQREDALEPWTERPSDNDNPVFMGVDWAEGKKGGDATSVQIVEKLPSGRYMHRFSLVLSGGEYAENMDNQIAKVAQIARLFRPTKISVDHGGLGIKVGADLKKEITEFNVDLVDFTHQNKSEMAITVKNLMEQDNLWLQADDRPLQVQLHSLKREITKHGNTLFSGEPHDDMFWALALACRAGGYKPFTIYQLGGGR